MTFTEFVVYMTAMVAVWQLPSLLSFMICMIGIAIVVPSAVPRSWKL